MMDSAKLAALNSRTIDISKKQVFMSAYIQGWKDADQHPQWIPVEELVPDLDDDVLVYDSAENRMFVAHHAGDWYTTHGDILLGVTHWMPIVPPRKEE